MYNCEPYRSSPKEEPSSSDLGTQGMNANGGTPNEGASSDFQQLLQLASSSGFCPGQGLQRPLAPLTQVNGAFQQPPLQGNPGDVYSGVSPVSYEPNRNNTTGTPGTPLSCQGCGIVPTNMPYGGLPTASPNLPNGQASNPGSSFQVAGQPPTMPWRGLYPDLFARPDAQGIPGPLWEMNHVEVNHQGGDDLQVVIHFRKMRPS